MSAIVGGEEKGKSEGSKKKTAQTMAALDALQNLEVDLSCLDTQVSLSPHPSLSLCFPPVLHPRALHPHLCLPP